MESKELPVAPTGWEKIFIHEADLVEAYARLEGFEHFYTDALRGRIRYYQGEATQAWHWYDLAREKGQVAESSVKNALRRFHIEIFRLWLTLITADASLDSDAWEPDEGKLEEEIASLEVFAERNPDVREKINERMRVEAAICIANGRPEAAQEIVRPLLEQDRKDLNENLAADYFSLGVAAINMDQIDEGLTNLENAGMVVHMQSTPLSLVRFASRFQATYSYLGKEDQANEWREFFNHLPCPEATKQSFRRRANLTLERSAARNSLVLI